jgi:isopenicillin-N epimerase
LATPAAIEFQRQYAWDAVRDRCHHLVRDIRRRVNALTGLGPICPESSQWFGQMSTIRLPEIDADALQDRLRNEYQVEIPIIYWNGELFLRVSIQGYNDQADADALIAALEELLP